MAIIELTIGVAMIVSLTIGVVGITKIIHGCVKGFEEEQRKGNAMSTIGALLVGLCSIAYIAVNLASAV